MDKLKNPVQRYAWGSPTAIPRMFGLPETGEPHAEMWLGAHPSAPSKVKRDGHSLGLDALIASKPETHLGSTSFYRFGAQLPFLLKVLAAAEPLSLQAHPDKERARRGFAHEEAAGVPADAHHRRYRDANHKPELILALTEFHALSGFRRVDESVALLRALGLDTSVLESRGLATYFEMMMTSPREEQDALARRALEACRGRAPAGFEGVCEWGARIGEKYTGDIGIVGALLLNYVVLSPGQALYLPAGNLHAYLLGTGVEIMASSDNVLRGGLTPKHVDVEELVACLDFRDGPVPILEPEGDVAIYETPAEDFELSRLRPRGARLTLDHTGPEIVLVLEGELSLETDHDRRTLGAGESVFIGADEGVTLHVEGEGIAYRATVGSETAGLSVPPA
ncbi:MAG TPA: mannose-6-phosphate isomerase, class I [Polyangiaceae bacterium]|nr:mannose-6-phosphate isomerase, class I [Polyangiaceae bacterium]